MKFKPCDLIFSNPVPVLCEMIKSHQKMPYSHIAIATGIEDEVIGMEAEGCTKRNLHEDEKKDFARLRHDTWYDYLLNEDIPKILGWTQSKVGLKIYDYASLLIGIPFGLDVHTESWLVCSSFVYEAFKQAGIKLVQRRESWQVELIHIWTSPLLEEVRQDGI